LLTDDVWLLDPDDGLVTDGYDEKGEMGGETTVHDHLAWGLVGSYDGARTEEFYRRTDDGETDVAPVDLEHLRTEEMREGDFYDLVGPDNDIHQVRTSSDVPSVKVHLLGAELGRIQRHQFDTEAEFVELFQSHDTNVRCEAALPPPDQHRHTHTRTLTESAGPGNRPITIGPALAVWPPTPPTTRTRGATRCASPSSSSA
jgi:hypothetical protein